MEDIKKFNKGMSQDINPLDQPEGTYISADNLRIVSDVSGSSLSITNILGNSFNILIPDTTNIQKITFSATTGLASLAISTSDGTTQQDATLFSTVGATYLDLYNYIINSADYTFCAQNLLGISSGVTPLYNIYYGTSYIIFVPIIGAAYTINLISVSSPLTLVDDFVPEQTGLEPIGFTTIRNDIYIFTTNNKDTAPTSVGQVWKYNYDKVSFAGTLELIYNNWLNFSTYWNISPTATLGRYENNSIQRIYWTDFYSKLRSLNVADPQSMALDVSQIDVVPSIDFDIPLLQGVGRSSQSQGTKMGVVQMAYRLKKTTGAITNYSELSNIVTLVTGDESGAGGGISDGGGWSSYVGGGKGAYTNKKVIWKIDNIDQDFDFIEPVILFRDTKDGVPEIGTMDQIEINGNDSIIISYDGSEELLPVTLPEFVSIISSFTHCKTIATKDNKLFAGNVKNIPTELNWDARAFRSNIPGAGTNGIVLTNNGVSTTYADVTTAAEETSEEDDCINDYTNIVNPCIFKPGASSPILGGAGVNVSYEFYTIAIASDTNIPGWGFDVPPPSANSGPSLRTNTVSTAGYAGYWHLGVNGVTNQDTVSGQYYPSYSDNLGFKIKDGFKFPQVNGLLRGYQRGEIYRFGIQFYDKSKNPLFVKWIGDIKMPYADDYNNNSYFSDGITPTGIEDFRHSFVAGFGEGEFCFSQSLGIKFTINNLDSIKTQIDGYTIVRVKRSESDKITVCQGYTTRCDEFDPGTGNVYYQAGASSGVFPNELNIVEPGYSSMYRGFFSTPNINDGSLSKPDITMKMVSRSAVNLKAGPGADTTYAFYKYYNKTQKNSFETLIDQIEYINHGANTTDSGFGGNGNIVANYEKAGDEYSIGNSCYYYRTRDVIPPDADGVKNIYNIERALNSAFLASMYGGNTFNNRSNNEYISCGHYRPIRNSLPVGVDNFEVFGGDTFIDVYDSMRLHKNYSNTTKYAFTFYLPLESPVNMGLRSGKYVVKDLRAPGAWDEVETNEYNNVYSAENDIRTYIPKPNPFIINDEFDNRIYASQLKINGELSDSWGEFKVNDYWDVEGSYGPINAMTNLNDKMYFWQSRAFGTMSINPRVMVQDTTNGTDLQLGTGNVLQRHDYITTEAGLQHQYGVTKSNSKLFWMDIGLKKMFTYADGQALTQQSDIKGLFSFFSNNLKNNILKIDKPLYEDPTIGINGVRCVYDFKYNQAIFTFSDGYLFGKTALTNKFTVVLDENINAFTSFVDYTPKMYISDGYRIMSPDPRNRGSIYMHDLGEYVKYYDTTYLSSLKFVSNKGMEFDKVFDNITYDSQATTNNSSKINQRDDTWNTIRVYNDYQNTDYQDLVVNTNIKRRERSWKLDIPRNRVLYTGTSSPDIFTDLSPTDIQFAPRMRDKYVVVDLIYNNANNLLLAFNNLKTIFRISDR